MSNEAPDVEVSEIFLELADAASALDDLPDAARVTAWASSMLGVWAEDAQASQIDAEFIEWLAALDHPMAPQMLLALAGVIDVEAGRLALARAEIDTVPPWADHVDSARPTRAWVVHQGTSLSVGVGFRLGDGSELSLLADITDGALASLICAPGPEELFDGSEDLVGPQAREVTEAVGDIVAAWRALVADSGPVDESVYVNAAVGARRLGAVADEDLTQLRRPQSVGQGSNDVLDAIDPAERAELNEWALSVLDGAGVGPGTSGPGVLTDPLVPAQYERYPAREREAFAALEWADWLGVVLGLARAPAGTVIDPGALVDFINRCPEVTSSIPKRDRAYFEWAWSMVLPIWQQAGVVDDHGRLSGPGPDHLVAALRRAWA